LLFLGAGASLSARDKHGNHPPSGQQLGELLSKEFLGGEYGDFPLDQIAEYAISESDLITVQEFIRDVFQHFEPSDTHRLIPSFFWYGIATTNYDRVIERAYETTPDRVQVVRPFIANTDRIEDILRDPKYVALFKLHGCITRTADRSCPILLSTDQFIRNLQVRNRLFDYLKNWGSEKPILFIGHSLQDPDLRNMILQVSVDTATRPRYYAVVPDFDDIQQRYWDSKKITLIKGTCEEFFGQVSSEITPGSRQSAIIGAGSIPPEAVRFQTENVTLSQNCEAFLTNDVEFVKRVSVKEPLDAKEFYRGAGQGWGPMERELDVTRDITESMLLEHFLIDEADHLEELELVLVKAHAGAGKSVLLRRLAWDAAYDYDCFCLYMRPYGVINAAALQEIIEVSKKHVFLFVDDTADRVREIQALFRYIGPEKKQLTLITAERINEWNVSCGDIAPLVTTEYELEYLSSREIDSLLQLLEKHKALGTLEKASYETRKDAFESRAGRQLLVALHEATLGRPFEDIIEDEFSNIQPPEAQEIYLSICVLNRLNISVRAGIISRMYDVPFSEFKARFFAPLEHVVFTGEDPIIREYVYSARHPYIAQIVFERILRTQEQRYDAYIKCLRVLNINYSADNSAFRQMVRGRNLLYLFPNHELVKGVFELAAEKAGDDPHLFHQMAIYEMHRPNGSLEEAGRLLRKAEALAPYDQAIKHSYAELNIIRADSARTPLERDALLEQADDTARSLITQAGGNTYSYHTLAKVKIRKLRASLENPDDSPSNRIQLEKTIKETESTLSEGLQRFPSSSHLLEADAQFAALPNDSPRALESLRKAFSSNPRNSIIAIRLNKYYVDNGNREEARKTLEKALDANRNDPRLYYSYARLLMETDTADSDAIAYYLKRSFTPGDKNYDAQILYGRHLFQTGNLEDSRAVFDNLRGAPVGGEMRNGLLYPLDGLFLGTIERIEPHYCWIARDGLHDWIFCHKTNVHEDVWKRLELRIRVQFRIAFNMKGANAFAVEL